MRLRAGVLAVTVAALLLPQTAALAHPGHDHDPAAAAADEPALDWANYDRVTLTKNVGEPIGLKVLPDLTVLTTARDGSIRHTDPDTGVVNVVAKVPVYANSEDGLQNLALDPDFENNGWVYLYYAPAVMDEEGFPTSTPQGSAPTVLPAGEDEATYWDQWKGYNQLTRAKWDFEARTLDLATEQVILKVGVERGQCCHVGGDIDFDLDGNVLVSTGDNTPASAPGANGFAPNNDAPGMNPGLDARRSAGNSNDLRGSILRVTVAEDGSYTIPEGNLWEPGTENTRPEIFATGLRNPFRMAVDPESGAVTWGDYGPDSGVASADRGPMGYVEWQSTTKALYGGWPYCHGPNANYNNWDFATATGGEFFTCETGATNDSRWNTGLDTLPPATAPQLYYGDNPGDQPFPELVEFSPSGGQGPMGGPVFHYDETITNPGQLPEYWDGKAFLYEYSQDYVAAISLEGLGTSEGTNWDGAVEKLENFMPNEALETANQPRWSGPIDMEIGPDGAMYVLDYGKGFFRQNPEAGLYRIEYAPGNKAPIALATATPTSSATAPATIAFDGAGSSDPEGGELTYAWDFDGDTRTDATTATAQHTFATTGRYTVSLRVTDPEGKSGVTSIVVTVGNEAPVLTREYPADGGFFTWGDVLPYKFTATDAEDGPVIACNRLNWTFGLGHDSHAHPLQSISRSCEGGLTTPADAVEHGETEKLYGVIVAKYTDAGSPSAAAATSEVSSIVNTREQQAEHSNSLTGAERVADDSAQAFQKVVFGESGQLTYDTVNFVNIDGATARAQGTGTVELRWGAADAAPFATATIAAASGWSDVAFTGVDGQAIAFPSGTGALVVTASSGLQLDSWTVNGAGLTALPPVEPEPEELIEIPAEQVSMGMYSLTNWVSQDGLAPVMDRLSTIGFENIEPFSGTLRGFSAEGFRALADNYGFDVPSSHYNVNEATFADTLAFVKTLGQRYVGSGGFAAPGISTLENTLATAATMNRLGEQSVANGTGKLFGHNHAVEFTTIYPAGDHADEALSAWEILVRNTNPEYVTFQVDVAWAAHAGVDVVALLEEYGDRISLLHVKDATGLVTQERPTFVNLGEGDVPLQAILTKAEEVGVDLYVMEYDGSPANDSFSAEGFEYLTGLEAGEANPTPAAYPVTAAAVTFTDAEGTAADTYTIPSSGGVEYLVGDAVVRAGTYPGTGEVTVTARATKGFVLAEGSTSTWTFTFTDAEPEPELIEIPAEQVSMQMFALTSWVSQDGLVPVLDRLSTIGFQNIEPFGGTMRGFSAENFRALTDTYDLNVPSSHYNNAEATFADTLAYVKTLGQRYVGSGGFAAPGITSLENTLATADTMDRLGALSVANGTGKFFGHNHDGEFTTMYEYEGEMTPAWEILVAETDPELVTFEVDVAWAAHAGVDVVELLEEHGDRIDLLHIKDATNLGGTEANPRPVFANLGEGDVPLQEILAEAVEQDVDLFVMEYDGSPANEVFAKEGFEYLTGLEAGAANPTPVAYPVTPAAVTFTDAEGTAADTYTIPSSGGVEYLVGDAVVRAGTYPGTGEVTVTARATKGFVLAEGSTSTWTFTFTDAVPNVVIPAEQVSMQMFALSSWVNQDGLAPVLDRLSTIGFENIEPFGNTVRGFSAPDFRALTDTYDLNVPSSHYNVAEGTFADTLAYVKTLGQRYVGSGGFAAPGITSLENTLATADTMDRLGALSVANGTGKFFGHNHAGEFTTMYEYEGEMTPAWEILVAETDPELVTFEVDVAWAAHAGVDVVELLEEHGDRIDLLHIKDATGLVTQPRPTFVNLGEGDVPLQEILAEAVEQDVDLFVMEYDGSPANEVFAKEGFEYLTGLEAGAANPTPVAYPVTPAAVTFNDVAGTTADTYTVPNSGGVEYLVGDAVVRAGTYPGTGDVTVTARAAKGFALVAGSTASWSFTFDPAGDFVDVPEGMLFFEDIQWLFENEISTGWETEDGREYRPLTPIARDAMAAFLYRQANSPEFTAPTVSPFSDVSTDNQFYKEITWLHDQEISTGWANGDGTFSYRPLDPINRDAMAAFLYRMADEPEFTAPTTSPFTDMTPETQFYSEVTWLVSEGIATGWLGNDGTAIYRPTTPINRDAMAAFLHRYDDAGFSNVGD